MALGVVTDESESVRIRFDPDQRYQLEAIESVVGLFEGQELAATQAERAPVGRFAQGALVSEHGMGNAMSVADRQIAANMAAIQDSHRIPEDSRGETPEGELASRDFTVEMETGTGKTYVYLRTIFELHRAYGWTKFVIVVPSVAIREGVEANLRLLADHLAQLYDGVNYDTWVYDSKAPARLRAFAQANYLQILIINIDAFNKADVNTIFRPQDEMMGYAPIELLRSTAPIVVLDEPQNMESETARAAISSLNPLFKLRYSATHLDTYHQVYRLTPADAYNLGLVKQIEVWSVLEDENANRPYIKLLQVKAGKRSISARLEIDVLADGSVARKRIRVDTDSTTGDLAELAGRSVYDGYVLAEIRTGEVEFENGVVISEGQEIGPNRDVVQRVQIRTAISQHLDKELDLLQRVQREEIGPLKVLSLFFIDRVENYWPEDGKFRRWFEEEYEKVASLPKYADLNLPPAEKAHGGYFARDRAGGAKDTRGGTKADVEVYELIMRDKQRLLSTAEPLRFIFSHSALREGWDNPNVFVITTLNESRSELKKRQEIGRGLRLPVMGNGERCRERPIATLAIVANEAYEEFAAQLQGEIEEESGASFEREKIKNGRLRRTIRVKEGYKTDPAFTSLWDHIKQRTKYSVRYETDALIETAAERLGEMPALDSSYVRASHAAIAIDAEQGVEAELLGQKAPVRLNESFPIPDLITHVAEGLPVSRATVARTLVQSKRLGEVAVNPHQFVDLAREAIQGSLAETMLAGIKYTRRTSGPESTYEMSLFSERELTGYGDNLVKVANSIYSDAVCDSDLERRIALALDKREDIQLFIKLPGWFTVETPVGSYNPDWAIVKQGEGGEEFLSLVRESKPQRDPGRLRPEERLKTGFGRKHFEALGISFELIDDPSQV